MSKRTIYWYSKKGEFGQVDFYEWSLALPEIPEYSWVYEPHTAGISRACGFISFAKNGWVSIAYETLPAEFKMQLLLMGVL